jgi:hypothetical protein
MKPSWRNKPGFETRMREGRRRGMDHGRIIACIIRIAESVAC